MRHKEAEAALREAIRLKLDDAEAHFNLGNALRGQGKFEEALKAFRRAAALLPDGSPLRQQSQQAIKGLEQLIEAVGTGVAPGDRKKQPVKTEESIGALVLQGGGATPDAVRDRFLELAGGQQARLVVIPTASEDAHRTGQSSYFEFWKKTPAASVVLLHTLDREQANDAAFVKPLTEATGVWLGGGDQARLIAAYHGTAVERELHKLLARGGVIGGTSAGASAMSALMIVGGNPEAEVGPGFGFALVEDVVIDQHFTSRNRLPRLQGILTRYTDHLGLGIDTETAVVIQGRTATVIGEGAVRLCLPATVRELEPVQVYKDGDRIDLGVVRQAVQVAPK
jgi:cyanophycinase